MELFVTQFWPVKQVDWRNAYELPRGPVENAEQQNSTINKEFIVNISKPINNNNQIFWRL